MTFQRQYPRLPHHVNGKPSKSICMPPTASTSTAASSVLSAATPPANAKPKKVLPQRLPHILSSHPPSESDTSSPSIRNVDLPTRRQQQPHQGQSSHTRPNPSQLAHSFTPFVPGNTMRPPRRVMVRMVAHPHVSLKSTFRSSESLNVHTTSC